MQLPLRAVVDVISGFLCGLLFAYNISLRIDNIKAMSNRIITYPLLPSSKPGGIYGGIVIMPLPNDMSE